MTEHESITRAAFLKRASMFLGAVVLAPADPMRGMMSGMTHDMAHPSPLEHPDPRPGITGERVLADDAIGTTKGRVLDAYEYARTYPGVFDGLACACGCTGKRDGMHRSLLVCFETKQPSGCHGCQEEAEFVARLAKKDTPLDEIRAAVDKKFG